MGDAFLAPISGGNNGGRNNVNTTPLPLVRLARPSLLLITGIPFRMRKQNRTRELVAG
ncbi:hypothetical protein PTI98_009114 [Pleurotus ostreatus]|nr:hypothetical protein PTI98_009114 [Pleurotus ostreatus]